MKQPVLFLGHGSPMNAIEQNPFTEALTDLGRHLARPKAILVVSAHWMTRGTYVTHMQSPKTIHDFHGFPEDLFQVQYPAPGAPEVADLIRTLIPAPQIQSDEGEWGLDHGTWSVLKFLFPRADVPVLQLSLDMTQPPEFHFKLGEKLGILRDRDILMVASGNIVHNLRAIQWEPNAKPHDWALEFDHWVKEKIEARDLVPLIQDPSLTPAGKLSNPTPDHYYPLLYALGASHPDDSIETIFEGIQHGSISMRCVKWEAENTGS